MLSQDRYFCEIGVLRNMIREKDWKILLQNFCFLNFATKGCKSIFYTDCRYTTDLGSNQHASTAFAQWLEDSIRLASIREFLLKMKRGKSPGRVAHLLALVQWNASHPQRNRYSKPVEGCTNYFESMFPEHAYFICASSKDSSQTACLLNIKFHFYVISKNKFWY